MRIAAGFGCDEGVLLASEPAAGGCTAAHQKNEHDRQHDCHQQRADAPKAVGEKDEHLLIAFLECPVRPAADEAGAPDLRVDPFACRGFSLGHHSSDRIRRTGYELLGVICGTSVPSLPATTQRNKPVMLLHFSLLARKGARQGESMAEQKDRHRFVSIKQRRQDPFLHRRVAKRVFPAGDCCCHRRPRS